jgi:hypothetical protein
LLHRYVRTIKTHTNNATGLPKGKLSAKQPVLVLGIVICRVILGVDGVSTTSHTPALCKRETMPVYSTTFSS